MLNRTQCSAEVQEREITEIKSMKRPNAMQRSMAVWEREIRERRTTKSLNGTQHSSDEREIREI